MQGYWAITNSLGRPLAVIKANSEEGAKWRVVCLGLWDASWQVRQSTAEEYARLVKGVLMGEQFKNAFWFDHRF
jgi:hypothetical protein